MAVAQMINRLLGRQAERKQTAGDQYREVVRGMADGSEPDPDILEELLRVAGKTLEDLKGDVELLLKRREWAAEAAAGAGAHAEMQNVRAEIARLSADLAQHRREVEERQQALVVREQELMRKCLAAQRAEQRLNETADRDLVQRGADLARQAKQLDDQASELRQHSLAQAQANLAMATRYLEEMTDGRRAPRDQIARQQEEVRAWQERVEDHEKYCGGLERRAAELRRESERFAAHALEV